MHLPSTLDCLICVQGTSQTIMQRAHLSVVAAVLLSLEIAGPLRVSGQPQLPGPPGTCNSGCCNLGRTVFEGACSSFVRSFPLAFHPQPLLLPATTMTITSTTCNICGWLARQWSHAPMRSCTDISRRPLSIVMSMILSVRYRARHVASINDGVLLLLLSAGQLLQERCGHSYQRGR